LIRKCLRRCLQNQSQSQTFSPGLYFVALIDIKQDDFSQQVRFGGGDARLHLCPADRSVHHNGDVTPDGGKLGQRAEGRQASGRKSFQSQLKDIVYVDFPDVGLQIKKGDTIGSVESVKTLADIYSPVTGKVTEINSSLKDHPQYVNEDPFGKGWMIKIAVQNKDDLKGLLSAEAYQGLIPEES